MRRVPTDPVPAGVSWHRCHGYDCGLLRCFPATQQPTVDYGSRLRSAYLAAFLMAVQIDTAGSTNEISVDWKAW